MSEHGSQHKICEIYFLLFFFDKIKNAAYKMHLIDLHTVKMHLNLLVYHTNLQDPNTSLQIHQWHIGLNVNWPQQKALLPKWWWSLLHKLWICAYLDTLANASMPIYLVLYTLKHEHKMPMLMLDTVYIGHPNIKPYNNNMRRSCYFLWLALIVIWFFSLLLRFGLSLWFIGGIMWYIGCTGSIPLFT